VPSRTQVLITNQENPQNNPRSRHRRQVLAYAWSESCSLSWARYRRSRLLLDGLYNPFPSYAYTGSLHPWYPLSSKRAVPDHIPKPDYSITGDDFAVWYLDSGLTFRRLGKPVSEVQASGQPPKILNAEEIQKMRTVCRVRTFLVHPSRNVPSSSHPFFFIVDQGGFGSRSLSRSSRRHHGRTRRDRT